MLTTSCVECGKPCHGVDDGAPSRCRACLILREVYPLPPNIETT
jgi:hypothetical protein